MKLYNIKVYFNKLKKKRFNGNLHVPVHSSLLEELVGLLICASYIAMQNLLESGLPPGLGQLQQLQQCSRPASTPGISLIILGPQHSPREQEEGSSVSKQFIGALGLGVYGETIGLS